MDNWPAVKKLFHSALRLEPSERQDFLREACGDDSQLYGEVESLLGSLEKSGTFLDRPAVDLANKPEVEWRLQQDQIVSHYKIKKAIASGGMGEVYLAEDVRLHREVALKILRNELFNNLNRMLRLEREATAASALNHPNILTIYEFDVVDGMHLIATEYVPGETLRERITKSLSGLSISETLDIAIQVASALAAAHRAGVFHRDIKPENLMVRNDGYLKVLDFGLAKIDDSLDGTGRPTSPALSDPSYVMGTASYMSPEQARGLLLDHRTDIFSLGVVMYEMLTGVVPFNGPTAADTVAAIIHNEPAAPSTVRDDVPSELDRVILRCIEKGPTDRFQDALELIVGLEKIKRQMESRPSQQTR